MARIEGIRIQNYRALQDVTLGKLWNTQKVKPLTPVTAVIGKNGTGKTTLFDAFGFLADCLRQGVEKACDEGGRGGFEKIRSQGASGPVTFEVYYRQNSDARPITYELSIDLDDDHRPFVSKERLRQRRSGQRTGRPFSFLILNGGKGVVWKGDAEGESLEDRDEENIWLFLENERGRREFPETETVELSAPRMLGIATLGALKQHPRISAFRQFIEGWYLSYFAPDAARGLPMAGPQPHLNTRGDNLGNVVQFMEREHPGRLKEVLARIADRIPGIERIDTHRTEDGRLLLRFNDRGFEDPFFAGQMSDGTLKMLAYLLLLEDRDPPPFICIEEPENGLYHKLLWTLANELRLHAGRGRRGSQVFVTTHQPYFVDALNPSEVWILEKGEDGFSTARRASDDAVVSALVEEGLPLGGLWFSDYLDSGQA